MNVLDPEFLRELAAFLEKATRTTYAGNGKSVPEADVQRGPGFKEFIFADGDWSYRDSYTGHLTSAGQEVIWHKGRPVWSQSYGGGMSSDYRQVEFARQCSTFLKDALLHGDKMEDFQPRGPRIFRHDDLIYRCEWKGDIRNFRGREDISLKGDQVFFHEFFGGVIVHDLHE